MVVNAGAVHEGRLLAPDLEQHPEMVNGIVFVREVIGAVELLVADELPPPVTLLAGLARGAQVANRGGDGAGEAVPGDGPDLSQARELRADEPVRSRTDVALHTLTRACGES